MYINIMGRPALIVIDMLEEFVNGRLSTPEAKSTVNPAKKVLEEFRKRGLYVFYVKDSHQESDFEIRLWGPHAMRGSKDAQIIDELKPLSGEEVLEKHTYSGFFGTPLDYLLRSKGIDTIFLIGLDADICVRHTAADAFYRGYKIYVVEDAVAAYIDKNWKEYFEKVYGSTIIKSDDVGFVLDKNLKL
jgi:nicotinamidase-related amidase